MSADADRDSLGRFVPGHPGFRNGPGRPPRAREDYLIGVLREVITEDRLIAMVEACCKKAEEGDIAALKLLLAYLLGQPAQLVRLEQGRVILEVSGPGPLAERVD